VTVRVLAYNLFFGGADRLEAITAVLRSCDADLVCLTEADDPAVIAVLAERLNYARIWARGSGDRHIALLSRLPMTEWSVRNRPPLTQVVLQVEVQSDGIADVARNGPHEDESDMRRLSLFNTHLLPYLLLPFEIRRWQAVGELLKLINVRHPGPHLILGDLNAIAPNDRVLQQYNPIRMRRMMLLQLGLLIRLALPRLMKAGYTDCYRQMNPGADGFTWMPGNRTTRYDYIFADPYMAARLLSCRVVDEIREVSEASDHLPLLAEFG
jgi:exodeoxyribonuclease-3